MKLKRVISLLLLAVYLFAAGGPAYVSLSCSCVAMKAHEAHICGHDCSHSDEGSAAREALKAPCCGNHHSTEINLYTFSPDSEKSTRCAVVDLPPALMAEAPAIADAPLHCEQAAERPLLRIVQESVGCAGLRAPPVLA